jgi:beta-galactosidase
MPATIKFLSFLLLYFSFNLTAQESKQRKLFFDDNWKFSLGDVPQAKNQNFDDKTWRSLDLPHDWSIEGKISIDNPTH